MSVSVPNYSCIAYASCQYITVNGQASAGEQGQHWLYVSLICGAIAIMQEP